MKLSLARVLKVVLLLLGTVSYTGCGLLKRDGEAEVAAPVSLSGNEEGDEDVAAQVAAETRRHARRASGKELYRFACATCHGARGKGKGPSAVVLEPRPRDFTGGVYKWRSTESGALPLDSDIFRTISRGVPGTMMPGWKDLLSEEERWSVVEYIKRFSSRFEEEGVFEDEIVKIPEPVPATTESVARGKVVYEANKCWECHGREGRGDGPSAPTLKDSWGNPIKPFDFTLGGYRGGGTDRDIYRVFFTGLNGTPMPAYGSTIPDEDKWPLVHYVRSLQRSPGLLERILFEVP